MSNQLYASAEKRCINPSEDIIKKLVGISPHTVFDQIDGEGLFLRVIVIKNEDNIVVFLHYELDQPPFPFEMMKEINEKYGVPEEQIFILGNHSHEVPLTGIRAGEPRHNEERSMEEHLDATLKYEAFLKEMALEAVDEAMHSLQPARLGWGEGSSDINTHGFTRNKLNVEESPVYNALPLDKSLFVMRLERIDGTPIAFMLNYSTHNNCVHVPNILSADVEGYISALMENHFPGSICIWTLAAHGDISARGDYWNVHFSVVPPEFADPAKTTEATIRCERILALRQFEDTLRTLDRITCKEVDTVQVSAGVDYVDVPVFPASEQADGSIVHMGGMAVISSQQRQNADEHMSRMLEGALLDNPMPYHLRLHIVRFGDLVFIGNGGKLFNSFKIMMRNALPVGLYGVVLSQDACADSTITYVRDERKLFEMADSGEIVTVKPKEMSSAMKETYYRLCVKAGISPLGE